MNNSTYRQRQLREKVLRKLGNKCAFCEYDTEAKLWIDKIKDDGDPRKTGMSYLNKILWDKTGNFRLLCPHHKLVYKNGTFKPKEPNPGVSVGWPTWTPEKGENW